MKQCRYPSSPTGQYSETTSTFSGALPLALLVVVSLAIACGADPATSNGVGVTCAVGETLMQDSQGNKFCQKAGDAGVIGGTDSGAGTDVATGADTAGTGKDAGSTGGTDAGGAGFDGSSAGVDAGPIDPWWSCPPVKKASGAEHGKACTSHADCLYGNCVKGGHLAGYDDSISYCSKNNACTGGTSSLTTPCGTDDGAPNGVTYKSVFEKSKSGGNTKRTSAAPVKVCGRVCKSSAECASWNPKMPDCMTSSTDYVSLGTQGVCGYNPLK